MVNVLYLSSPPLDAQSAVAGTWKSPSRFGPNHFVFLFRPVISEHIGVSGECAPLKALLFFSFTLSHDLALRARCFIRSHYCHLPMEMSFTAADCGFNGENKLLRLYFSTSAECSNTNPLIYSFTEVFKHILRLCSTSFKQQQIILWCCSTLSFSHGIRGSLMGAESFGSILFILRFKKPGNSLWAHCKKQKHLLMNKKLLEWRMIDLILDDFWFPK